MKKMVILMVLALAACGGEKNSPAPLAAPSVYDMLENDSLLKTSFEDCKKNGGFDKAERSAICKNAFKASGAKSSINQLTRCPLKTDPEAKKACFEHEYLKYKE